MSNLKNKDRRFRLTKGKLLTFGVVLFSLGVVTSVTSTYAWYNLKQIGAISNLNLSINYDKDTENYLKLYLATEKDKKLDELVEGESLIWNEDGYTSEQLGMKDVALTDVSGMFSEDWLSDANPAISLPKLHTSYRSYREKTNPGYCSDSDVYVQNVFYLEAGLDCSIYLDGTLDEETGIPLYTYVRPNQELNMKVAQEQDKDVNKLNQVTDSVRISFYTDDGYIIANPGKNQNTLYGGILDLNKDGYYDTDENGNEILYGQYIGIPARKINTENDDPMEDGTTFVANHLPGANMVDFANSSDLTIAKENAVDLDTLRYDDSHRLKQVQSLCQLKAGQKKRIVVTIYIEGWDLSMTDDIASASFDISLSFTALFDK